MAKAFLVDITLFGEFQSALLLVWLVLENLVHYRALRPQVLELRPTLRLPRLL